MESIAKSYPGDFKVKFEAQDFDTLLEKSNQDLALGTGQYDVIMQYNFTLSSYVENNLVWKSSDLKSKYPSIDTTFEVGLFETAWKEVGYYYSDPSDENSAPSAFGYPFATNTLLLAVNQDLFDDEKNKNEFRKISNRDLTVPKTWGEYLEVAKFFSEKTDTSGVVMQGASGGWLYYEWAAIMSSQGLAVFQEKSSGWERGTKYTSSVNSAEMLEATRNYLKLRDYNAGGFENVDASSQIEILNRGEAAMAIVWSDFAPALFDNQDIKFSMNPLPGDYSPLAGGTFYINKKTKYPKEAFEFIAWIMQPEQQKQLLRNNLGSPSVNAYTPQIIADSKFAGAMKESIERGRYAFEANKDSELVNTEITKALQSAWRSPDELDTFLLEANKEINLKRASLLTAK